MIPAMIPRPPKGMARFDLDRESAKVLDQQVRLAVDYQLGKLTGYRPLLEQLQELARNCYLQGVLDGQQCRAARNVS